MHRPREGLPNKVLYGEAPPQGPNPYPFYIPFLREKVPLSYTFLRKWHPFHIPTDRVLLNLSFEKTLYFYTSILQLVKSLPFFIPPALKRYPFRAEPPRIVHYREYPPGGGGGTSLKNDEFCTSLNKAAVKYAIELQ